MIGLTAGAALFWRGCYHQVLASDDKTAYPLFARARQLRPQADDALMASYSLRHLAISRQMTQDHEAAERLLQEATDLRRTIGFEAGAPQLVVQPACWRPGPASGQLMVNTTRDRP